MQERFGDEISRHKLVARRDVRRGERLSWVTSRPEGVKKLANVSTMELLPVY